MHQSVWDKLGRRRRENGKQRALYDVDQLGGANCVFHEVPGFDRLPFGTEENWQANIRILLTEGFRFQ